MSQAQIVVVGSANADLVVAVERRPEAGETVLGGPLRVLPGGKGANQAVAAARLGGAVAFVGAVGSDGNGLLLKRSLGRAGVDLARLRTTGGPTGVAIITVTPDGDNSIVVSPGANADVGAADVSRAADLFQPGTIVVLQMELPVAVVEAAVRAASAQGCRVLLNLAPAANLADDVLASCDPLIVNEHEAAFLLGGAPLSPEALLARCPQGVVVTRGGDGALVVTPEGTTVIPAGQVPVVDTTGAGDAFAGALAWRLASSDGADLVAAARIAVKAASLSVTREGAQPSYPTAAEVLA